MFTRNKNRIMSIIVAISILLVSIPMAPASAAATAGGNHASDWGCVVFYYGGGIFGTSPKTPVWLMVARYDGNGEFTEGMLYIGQAKKFLGKVDTYVSVTGKIGKPALSITFNALIDVSAEGSTNDCDVTYASA